MESGGNKPIKTDDIPNAPKRNQNKVLGKALKTIFTGKPPSSGSQGDSSNRSKVAPE